MTAAQRDEDELITDESYLIKSNPKEKGSTYKEKVDEPIFFIIIHLIEWAIQQTSTTRSLRTQPNKYKQAMNVDERVRFFYSFRFCFGFFKAHADINIRIEEEEGQQ